MLYGYIIPSTKTHAITEDKEVYNFTSLKKIRKHQRYQECIYIHQKIRKLDDLLIEAKQFNKLVELFRTENFIKKDKIDEFYKNKNYLKSISLL